MRGHLLRRPELIFAAAVIWFAGLATLAISFQTPVASVSGRIFGGEAQAPIAGAYVTAWGKEEGTVRDVTVRTDARGNYRLESLPLGSYTIRAAAPGFQGARTYAIAVHEAKDHPGIDLALRPRTPNLRLYRSRGVFGPDEKVRLSAHGFTTARGISLTLYALDVEDLLRAGFDAWRWRQSHQPPRRQVEAWSIPITRFDRRTSDFDEKIALAPRAPGAYLVEAEVAGMTQRVTFMVSRIGLITKNAENRFLAYVVDTVAGEPVEGATVTLYDRTWREAARPRGYVLHPVHTGATDSDGLLTLSARTRANMVVARCGDSYAFTSTYGRGYYGAGEKVYVHTDRPVYRPGHTVHLKGTARKTVEGGYELPQHQRVWVSVVNPGGDRIWEQRLEMSRAQSFHGTLALEDDADVGYYQIATRWAAQGDWRHRASFRVEEYRKPEFRVSVSTPEDHYVGGAAVPITVNAEYYFGAPVVGARVSYRVYASGGGYSGGWLDDEDAWYSWGMAGDGGYYGEDYGYGEVVAHGTAATDKTGAALIPIRSRPVTADQTYQIEVDVADASRKVESAYGSVLITQGQFAIGLSPAGWLCKPRRAARVNLLVRDYEDKPVPGVRLRVVAERVRWSRTAYTYTEVAGADDIVTDRKGRAAFAFTPRQPGRYRVVAEAQDRLRNRVRSSVHLWVWDSAFTADYDYPSIELIPDKKRYEVGDTARIMINTDSPESPLLVTIEGLRLYDHRVLRMEGKSQVIEVPIEAEYLPNIDVSVSLFRGRRYVSAGAELDISPRHRFLRVALSTDRARYEPGQPVTYSIRTLDADGKPVSAEVSLGVVDEAIYAVAEESTPDIRDFFYGWRPNLVSTAYSSLDYYGGGDKDGELVVRKDFRDTAHWSPVVVTDDSGRASVRFTLPDSLTTWRATARAVTLDTRVGEARHQVIATKDLIARLSVPRFFRQRDEITVAGVIHNYTDASQKVRVALQARGLRLLDSFDRRITLQPRESQRLDWRVNPDLAGEAVLTLRAVGETASDAMQLTVPVLAHGAPRTLGFAGQVTDAEELVVNLPASASPGSAEFRLWLTPSIAGDLLGSLDYLASYPWGCIEQTLSGFIPDVVLTGVMETTGGVGARTREQLPRMVAKGMKRIFAMQNGDGGFGWYYDESNPYTTAHVVYALHLAKEAGYEVDAGRLDRAVKWLRGSLQPVAIPAPRHQDRSQAIRELNSKAAVVRALALEGQAPKRDLDELFAARRHLANHAAALLALALDASGDTARARTVLSGILSSAHSHDGTVHWTAGASRYSWLDSDLECTAAVLQAMLRVDRDNPLIPKAVRWVALSKQGDRWVSTKTTAAVIYALSDYVAMTGELRPDLTAAVRLNDDPVAEVRIASGLPPAEVSPLVVADSDLRPGRNVIRITREGTGVLYYSGLLTYHTGEEDIPAVTQGIAVTREYFRLSSSTDAAERIVWRQTPVRGAVEPGELINVKITVRPSAHYRYLLLVDPLPSGCEVVDTEAFRHTEEQREKRTWNWPFHRQQVRDAQMGFFATSVPAAEHVIQYQVRCEIPGDLHVMPTRVEAMYEPACGGSAAETRLRIAP